MHLQTRNALLICLLLFFFVDARAALPPAKRQAPVDLMTELNATIEAASQPKLVHDTDSPWSIIHGMLAVGKDYRVLNPDRKTAFLALEWLENGAQYKGLNVFENTPFGGRGHAYLAHIPGFEGHPVQFMGYLTELNLPLSFVINRKTSVPFTVEQILEDAKMTININPVPNTTYEASWALMFLAHYLAPDETWRNARGEVWNMERLVNWEAQSPVEGATCGGLHRLYALTKALNKHREANLPMKDGWILAQQRVNQYLAFARQRQNSDGSFSAAYFSELQYPDPNNLESRLAGSGHIFEWLSYALPKKQLSEPWMIAAARSVSAEVYRASQFPKIPAGPYYHALHGLKIYRERMQER